MSLDQWVENGWLVRHDATGLEIRDLLEAAQRDLTDAGKGLSPAWRFAIAYHAGLRLCTAALNSAGFRASREQKHYRTIAALPLAVGADARELADFLDRCRAKRHDVTYESLSGVSHEEAQELIEAVRELETRVREWLVASHPDLLNE